MLVQRLFYTWGSSMASGDRPQGEDAPLPADWVFEEDFKAQALTSRLGFKAMDPGEERLLWDIWGIIPRLSPKSSGFLKYNNY